MSELVEFLRACLAEDETALVRYRDGQKEPCPSGNGQPPDQCSVWASCYLHTQLEEAAPYRDAAFGLADIAAKRRILEEHGNPGWGPYTAPKPWCRVCHVPDEYHDLGCDSEAWPCPTLRLLASAYAGRPGYKEEWKP